MMLCNCILFSVTFSLLLIVSLWERLLLFFLIAFFSFNQITDHMSLLIVNQLCLFATIALSLATVIWMLLCTNSELLVKHELRQSNAASSPPRHLPSVSLSPPALPYQDFNWQTSALPITTSFVSTDPNYIPPLPKFMSSKHILTLHRAVGASTARSFSASTDNDLKIYREGQRLSAINHTLDKDDAKSDIIVVLPDLSALVPMDIAIPVCEVVAKRETGVSSAVVNGPADSSMNAAATNCMLWFYFNAGCITLLLL